MSVRPRSLLLSACLAGLSCVAASLASAAPGSLTVNVAQPGVRISPSLYGIFFEEINYAGDGGIYAEMLRNRSFEESAQRPEFWTLVQGGAGTRGDVSLVTHPGTGHVDYDLGNVKGPYNTHALRITATNIANGGRIGVANDGYWGVNVVKGKAYKLKVFATSNGDTNGQAPRLIASLENRAGEVYATQTVELGGSQQGDADAKTVTLNSIGTDPNARLVLSLDKPGTVDIDYVSLMPAETFKDQGFRPDLANRLLAMKPSFVRFPGGCWVEGDTMNTASNWKRTIGPDRDRWTQQNLWGYYSTNGLGYHEYLQLCEDLHADALFVVNVGMSHHGVVPMDQMQGYVQDALDAIEYAIGDTNTKWGKMRADAGHPQPFPLKIVEIGNENGGPAYYERYALIYDAIKQKYPQMRTVACDWAGGRPTNRPIDLLDEHYYNNPQWFFRNANRYDNYDRNGYKVYVGEYAVTQGCGKGNLIAALGEAAFMTGMERNSDVVQMASYAPLFANVNGKAWNPDAINFDNSRNYGTPSYYVQSMFSNNRGDVVLPATVTLATDDAATNAPPPVRHGAAGLGTWSTQAEFKDFEVRVGDQVVYSAANATGENGGWRFMGGNWHRGNDGTITQTGNGENSRAVVGDPSWTDYTIHVKARKTGGQEGFLILARAQDDENFVWFNVGGWDNTRTAFERAADGGKEQTGRPSNFRVENNRWYDIRVEVKGDDIRGYIDGQLVASAKDAPVAPVSKLFSTASRDEASGDVIVKVVNGGDKEQPLNVRLNGVSNVSGAKAWVLTGKPDDENTLDAPEHVVPQETNVSVGSDGSFSHTFPAYSVTILRLAAGK